MKNPILFLGLLALSSLGGVSADDASEVGSEGDVQTSEGNVYDFESESSLQDFDLEYGPAQIGDDSLSTPEGIADNVTTQLFGIQPGDPPLRPPPPNLPEPKIVVVTFVFENTLAWSATGVGGTEITNVRCTAKLIAKQADGKTFELDLESTVEPIGPPGAPGVGANPPQRIDKQLVFLPANVTSITYANGRAFGRSRIIYRPEVTKNRNTIFIRYK